MTSRSPARGELAPPSDHVVREALAAHRLPSEGRISLPRGLGVANHVRLVGNFCIRFLRDWEYECDVRTEVAAAPYVCASGALSPKLIASDFSGRCWPGPYTILERVPGEPVGMDSSPGPWIELAGEARKWHERIAGIDETAEAFDLYEKADPEAMLERATGVFSAAEEAWVRSLAVRLMGAPSGEHRFVHQDLHDQNVMSERGRLTGIIDWGDAGWGDSAVDFAYFPASLLPMALAEYGDTSEGMIGRCLLENLAHSLYGLAEREGWTGRSCRWRFGTLVELCMGEVGGNWRSWLGDTPPSTLTRFLA